MSAEAARDITTLLAAIQRGDDGARDRLVALMYGELRRMAARQMRRERRTAAARTRLMSQRSSSGRLEAAASRRAVLLLPTAQSAGRASCMAALIGRASGANRPTRSTELRRFATRLELRPARTGRATRLRPRRGGTRATRTADRKMAVVRRPPPAERRQGTRRGQGQPRQVLSHPAITHGVQRRRWSGCRALI